LDLDDRTGVRSVENLATTYVDPDVVSRVAPEHEIARLQLRQGDATSGSLLRRR